LDLSAGFVPKWTVIAEENIVQPYPHLAAETVLLVSVMADNSLLDLLSALAADCFYSLAHQTIFTAMLTLQSRGIAISPSTLENECAAAGKSDSLPVLERMSSLLAVDRATLQE
jgi:replicative DNA helicase